MDFLNSLFSGLLGGFGGGAAAAAPGMAGANPFSGVLSGISGLVGGPASQQGTLFSLPKQLTEGVLDLGASENIIGDTLGLANPILNLASKGLGTINPFGGGSGIGNIFGGGDSSGPISPLSSVLQASPFLALGAYGAYKDEQRLKAQQGLMR